VLGQRYLRFARPEHQARFEALSEALAGLTLTEAGRALEAGAVRDEATGEPVRWEPELQVLPVSERLKQQLSGSEYDDAVRGAREKYRFRVL
jgi:hypothetical protein